MKSTCMQEVSRQEYDAPGVSESYARNTKLLRAEEFILAYLADEINDRAVLDIGVGTGRTLPYLKAHTENYTGIDYSANMLKLCKLQHNDAKLLLCDARKMDIFAAGVFAAVFLFFNVLDDADHEDRKRILGEVRRVLGDEKFIYIYPKIFCIDRIHGMFGINICAYAAFLLRLRDDMTLYSFLNISFCRSGLQGKFRIEGVNFEEISVRS